MPERQFTRSKIQKCITKGWRSMNKTVKVILAYLLAAAMVIGYLVILMLPTNVCLEYRMYYLEDKLTEWPGYNGLVMEKNQLVSMDSSEKKDKHAGKGWGVVETGYRWTVGNTSYLYFTTECKDKMLINFVVPVILCDKFDVFINDVKVGSSENIQNGNLLCEFSGSTAKEDNLFEIRFDIINPKRPCDTNPESKDKRELGFRLASFQLLEDNTLNGYHPNIRGLADEGKFDYELGSVAYFGRKLSDDKDYCGVGFSGAEDDFRWTDGEIAYSYFNLKDQKPEKLILEVGSMLCDDYDIYLNNVAVATGETMRGTLNIDIPQECQGEEIIILELRLNNPKRPCDISESTDNRLLGLQIVSVCFI